MEVHVLPPAAHDLYKRVHRLYGVIETLKNHGEQLLVLSDEYPDCEVIHQLLTTLQTDLLEARRDLQETQTRLSRLGIPQKTAKGGSEP